jgi:hypothetical protein
MSHLGATNDVIGIPAGLLLEKLELPVGAARDDVLTRLGKTTGGYVGYTNADEGRT